MIDKNQINYFKNNNDDIGIIISKLTDVGKINNILENLGELPSDFNSNFLFNLIHHNHKKVRLNAVKNIGKLNGTTNFHPLINLFHNEEDTNVKREIISSLGRQRKKEYIDFFIECLEEKDPKIVSQAIRSLFVFDDNEKIKSKLIGLVNHPNEMIRSAIYKQYYGDKEVSSSKLPHSETYSFLKNVVVNANVIDALKIIPEDSIHLTFTSPPYYNARDYSIYPSYKDYLDFLEKVFIGTHRVTKEGRFLIVNTSPIIIPRISRAHSSKRYGIPFDLHNRIVKNGWEFIDDIIWLKLESSVKNRVGGFMQHRKPLGYKPNAVTEYLMVYRKETTKLLDWNIRSYNDDIVNESKIKDEFESNNVWKIDPSFDKVHSAVFPVELCKRVVKYYSFKGDLVFDPFAGSGTLGRTANGLDRNFFLTEVNNEYFNYMKSKLKNTSIFNNIETKYFTLEEFIKTIKL